MLDAYKAACFTLKMDSSVYATRVIATLVRWHVVPETLYQYQLRDESVTKQLDELYTALCDREKQWVSPNADKPADFWRSVLPVDAAQTAVRDKPKSTKGASAKTKTTKEASVKTKPKRPA